MEQNLPLCRPVNAGDQPGHRGFSTSALPHQTEYLSFSDAKGNIIHRPDRQLVMDAEIFFDMVQLRHQLCIHFLLLSRRAMGGVIFGARSSSSHVAA